jgi:PAS domain S-box-containing protein
MTSKCQKSRHAQPASFPVVGVGAAAVGLEALRQLSELPEQNPGPVLRVGLDGALRYANQAAQRWLATFALPAKQPLPPAVVALVARARRRYQVFEDEVSSPGAQIVLVTATRPRGANYVNLYGRDVTERKQAEASVLTAAREWRTTFDGVVDAMFVLDAQQCVQRCNKAARQLFRKPLKAILGRHCWELMHDTTEPIPQCPFQRMADSRQRETMELAVGKRWYRVVVDPLLDPAGEVQGAVHIVSEITERKKAAAALQQLNASLERRVNDRTAELAESEARFRTIFDTAGDGMFLGKMNGRGFYLANRACLDMLGYTLEEFKALPLKDLHPKDDLLLVRREMAKLRGAEVVAKGDVRFLRKDGSLLLAEFNSKAMRLNGKDYALVAIRDVGDRRRMELELERSHEALRSLLARLERAREEERTKVSRDIHDDLGQNLTAIKMDIQWIGRALGKMEMPSEAGTLKARVASAVQLADTMLVTVQELATRLRPGVLDRLGLGPAIQFEGRCFKTRTTIPCRTRIPSDFPQLPPDVTTALFRIFQECLTNVMRHADATQTSVQLELRGSDTVMRVRDNGSGIGDAALESPDSLGLLGMKERASMLHGETVFRRGKQGGTVVTVRIPTHE